MSKITIVAKITIKVEFTNVVYQSLLELYKSTQENESTYVQYDLHKNLEDKNSFTFIETWNDPKSFDEHIQKEHFQMFVKNTENKLENLEITKLEKI